MARNIEIKAYISDIKAVKERVDILSGGDPKIIQQEDIFFKCEEGRLKLRILSPEKGQLIFYQRSNKTGPKTSNYYISETHEPQRLLKVLERSCGRKGVVRKTRYLYLINRTQIHIDHVEELGDFIELEVVLGENDNVQTGEKEAYCLMNTLEIQENDLIKGAYIDLLMQKQV